MRRPIVWALLTTALVAIRLTASVTINAGGNWSALFYTGELAPVPPQLAAEDIHRVRGERGYDGQFYHYVAHDPWLARGFVAYVDNPPLRWRRILVPGLAWILAAGSDDYVDSLYVAVQLGFVLLGAWWLAWFVFRYGWHPAWGIGFVLFPAVLVSLDRMTIDLALAALTVGFVLFAGTPAVYPVLVLAALTRETGALLIVAAALSLALERRYREAGLASFCLLPAVAWWTWVASRTGPDGTPWLASYPFSGLIERTLHSPPIPQNSPWMRMAATLEWLALAGLWLAFAFALYLAARSIRRSPADLLPLTAGVWLVFASALGKADIWADAYAAGRTMTPLLIILALAAVRDRSYWLALPVFLILPRLLLQFQPQWKGILHGLIR